MAVYLKVLSLPRLFLDDLVLDDLAITEERPYSGRTAKRAIDL
jgi:hypothetical protein